MSELSFQQQCTVFRAGTGGMDGGREGMEEVQVSVSDSCGGVGWGGEVSWCRMGTTVPLLPFAHQLDMLHLLHF